MSRTLILAIDPGIQGALAFYDPNFSASVHDMPVHRALRGKAAMDVDAVGLMEIIQPYMPRLANAFVEQVQSRPRQGGQFYFGVNLGRLLGALESHDIPIVHVSAQKWKQKLGLRGEDKSMSVRLAGELFPNLALQLFGPRGAPLDGRAESLLIAYYGAHHATG